MASTAKPGWWDKLELKPATAQLMARRGLSNPADLAWAARAAPDDFRTVFDEAARADLAQALAAHLGGGVKDAAGYADLRDALEEVAGKRPPKPPGKRPELKFGAVPPPGPPAKHPLPKDLPPLGPPG